MDFDWGIILKNKQVLWDGMKLSLQLFGIALAGGIFFGTLLAMARLSSWKILSMPATGFVHLLRSVPFIMVESAYYSEIIRAGIQSIPRGQPWAAYALGMNYWQAMGNVVLPQAFR